MSKINIGILDDTIKVGFSGKALGNVSDNFGNSQDNDKNRDEFYKQFPVKKVAVMNTTGEDEVLNLDVRQDLGDLPKADGFITSRKDLLLSVFLGDCAPMVVYCPGQAALGLFHLATSNAALHFPTKAIRELTKAYKLEPPQLKVYIGPSIKKESYFFPESISEKKLDKSWDKFIYKTSKGWHIDGIGYIVEELKNNGLSQNQITVDPTDTAASQDYFSHRRSKLTGEPEGRNAFGVRLVV